jgi:hypothetical protein
MSWLSKLFGSGEAAAPVEQVVEHEGYEIVPEPASVGGQWRIGAVIRRDGREHRMIRADTMSDRGDCVAASVAKARQVIDQQGERLFD